MTIPTNANLGPGAPLPHKPTAANNCETFGFVDSKSVRWARLLCSTLPTRLNLSMITSGLVALVLLVCGANGRVLADPRSPERPESVLLAKLGLNNAREVGWDLRPQAAEAVVWDALGLQVASRITIPTSDAPVQSVILTVDQLMLALAAEPLGKFIDADKVAYLRVSVNRPQAGDKRWRVDAWAEDAKPPGGPLATAKPRFVDDEGGLAEAFVLVVQDALTKFGVPVTDTDFRLSFPLSFYRDLMTAKVERQIARRIGSNGLDGRTEASLLDQVRKRVDDLAIRYAGVPSAELLLEQFRVADRRLRLSFGRDSTLRTSRGLVRDALETLVTRDDIDVGVRIQYELLRGAEIVYTAPLEEAFEPYNQVLRLDPRMPQPHFFKAHRTLREMEDGKLETDPDRVRREVIGELDLAIEKSAGMHLWALAYKGRALGILEQKWDDAVTVGFDPADRLRADVPLVIYNRVAILIAELAELSGKTELTEQESFRSASLRNQMANLMPRLAASGLHKRNLGRLQLFDALINSDYEAGKAALVETFVGIPDEVLGEFVSAIASGHTGKSDISPFYDRLRKISESQEFPDEHHRMFLALMAGYVDPGDAMWYVSELLGDQPHSFAALNNSQTDAAAMAWATAACVFDQLELPDDANYAKEKALTFARP